MFNPTSLDELARQLAAAGVTSDPGRRRRRRVALRRRAVRTRLGRRGRRDRGRPVRRPARERRAGARRRAARRRPERGGRPRVRPAPAGAGHHGLGRRRRRASPRRARPSSRRIQSQPLPAVLAEMLTNSDNNTAELVLKEIGFATSGQGTRQAGIDAVNATLAALGRRPHRARRRRRQRPQPRQPDHVHHPAAGAAARRRSTARSGRGWRSAARPGTLVDVFGDTTVAGRIRGKTGTLNNIPFDQDPPAVKALAGYLPVDGGEAIEYVLILNGGIDHRPERVPADLGRARDRADVVPLGREPGGARTAMSRRRRAAPLAVLVGAALVPAVDPRWRVAVRRRQRARHPPPRPPRRCRHRRSTS